jgi:hypothetical protein
LSSRVSWRARWPALLTACAAATAAGCVQVVYHRRNVEDPVLSGDLAALKAGSDDLGSCLSRLGAPYFVWEYRIDGMALGWVTEDTAGWSVQVSFSFERYFNAGMSVDLADSDLHGVVLWFDGDLRLLKWQRGRMRDLVSGLHHRPAPVEDADAGGN